jgi:two-component system sensor histidine kinase YesM
VILKVADSGIGMNPEALQQLRASLEQDEGSGFGMKASYKRLRLMFGSDLGFDIESTENRGTEITIRIPYQTEVSA